MRIKIIADSTCDLSPEQLREHSIRRTPLTIVKGSESFKDGDEITQRDIFEYVESGHGLCQTTAINIGEYAQAYSEEFANGCDAILHFTMSAVLSAGYSNAVAAAADFREVYPIDTMSLSGGSGWLALYAAELVHDGLPASEIAALCEAKKLCSDASFMVDTLTYLHKGGRCSGVAALGANLLNLKPCLELRDGKIEVGKKYRGSSEKVLRQYIEDRLKDREDLDLRRAMIAHTYFDDPELVDSMCGYIRELQPFEEVVSTFAGCTISNHCGPGTFGLMVYRK